jgi:hypothetical protein
MKRILQSRFLLSIFGLILLTPLAFFAITKQMEGIAAAATGGIITIVNGYQISQAHTKSKFIQANQSKEIE